MVGIGGEQRRTHGLVGGLLDSTWQTIQNRLFSIHRLGRQWLFICRQLPNTESDAGWSGTERIAGRCRDSDEDGGDDDDAM